MNDIKNRLNLLWPGFYHTKNKDFWTAQWEKHGTCSGKGVKDYFQQAMDLASQVQEDLAAAAQFLLGTNLFFEYMTFYYVLQFSFEVLLQVLCKDSHSCTVTSFMGAINLLYQPLFFELGTSCV